MSRNPKAVFSSQTHLMVLAITLATAVATAQKHPADTDAPADDSLNKNFFPMDVPVPAKWTYGELRLKAKDFPKIAKEQSYEAAYDKVRKIYWGPGGESKREYYEHEGKSLADADRMCRELEPKGYWRLPTAQELKDAYADSIDSIWKRMATLHYWTGQDNYTIDPQNAFIEYLQSVTDKGNKQDVALRVSKVPADQPNHFKCVSTGFAVPLRSSAVAEK